MVPSPHRGEGQGEGKGNEQLRQAQLTQLQRFMELIIDLGFKAAAERHHPDRGGVEANFQVLGQAKARLLGLIEQVRP